MERKRSIAAWSRSCRGAERCLTKKRSVGSVDRKDFLFLRNSLCEFLRLLLEQWKEPTVISSLVAEEIGRSVSTQR